MKKLSLYIFLGLMWCNIGIAATLISLSDLKVNEDINDYFINKEISEYSYEGNGYGSKSDYSVLFVPKNKIKNNKYDSITIAYNNNTKKISYYAAFIEKFKNLNICLEFRDGEVLKNKKKFLFHKKSNDISTHEDGLIQETIRFASLKSSAAFSCDFFEDEKNSRVDFRFDVLTDKFNEWVVELNKTETTGSQN